MLYDSWGIYIHVPWCHRRCPYCDFYFEIGKSDSKFAATVLAELSVRRQYFPASPARTLYFGGGTPSLLSSEQLNQIISHIKSSQSLQLDAEITLEANSEDLNPSYLAEIKQAGVNRLSLGLQSFDDVILKWLGRKHDAKMARTCIVHALDAGFTRLSVDLIVGVPGEDWQQIRGTISWLSQVGVSHISVYVLTVEPLTPLERLIEKGQRLRPIEDSQVAAYEQGQAILKEQGYRQYEISSFAKPGQESQHNRLYWAQGSYLGLGPGAHSMLLQPDGSIYRRHTLGILSEWLKDPAFTNFTEDILDPNHALLESLAFGIRDLLRGVQVKSQLYRHKCALPKSFFKTVENLIKQGWIVKQDESLLLTPIGTLFADAVARDFLGM
jgi:oxygen-independent coproporphyrinogen III oxidase